MPIAPQTNSSCTLPTLSCRTTTKNSQTARRPRLTREQREERDRAEAEELLKQLLAGSKVGRLRKRVRFWIVFMARDPDWIQDDQLRGTWGISLLSAALKIPNLDSENLGSLVPNVARCIAEADRVFKQLIDHPNLDLDTRVYAIWHRVELMGGNWQPPAYLIARDPKNVAATVIARALQALPAVQLTPIAERLLAMGPPAVEIFSRLWEDHNTVEPEQSHSMAKLEELFTITALITAN